MQDTVTEFALLREKARLSVQELSGALGYAESTLYRWERGESAPRKAALEQLRVMAGTVNGQERSKALHTAQEGFRFIDLFAGIGGMRMGFEAAGGECVWTSEWNEYSRRTYQANFACNHKVAGDITRINERDIPAFDVLLAGFPCQPFSIAGVSKKNALGHAHGFLCETQGTLFFDVARIIEYHRPTAFLLENVKNLKSHDRGRTFRVMMDTLQNGLGYRISERIIDGKGYVPQHRERIFIAGFREDTGFNLNDMDIAPPTEGPRLGSILHPEDGTGHIEPPYTEDSTGRANGKYVLSDKLWKYLQDYADKHRAKGNGFGFGLCGPEDMARTLSARYYKDGSEILIRRAKDNPRRLTPRECARLMGFDAPGETRFVIPVSDTQAYKQFGNAVVVPVVREIALAMTPHILAVMDGTERNGKAIRLHG